MLDLVRHLTDALRAVGDKQEIPPPENATDALIALLHDLVVEYMEGKGPIANHARALVDHLSRKDDPMVKAMAWADRMALFPALNFLRKERERVQTQG